jgi:hypothetical protein
MYNYIFIETYTCKWTWVKLHVRNCYKYGRLIKYNCILSTVLMPTTFLQLFLVKL